MSWLIPMDSLLKSSALTWAVSGGDFVSGRPGELAADGDENTYLETYLAAQSSRVTVTCTFKRTYTVTNVYTLLQANSDTGINMALYRGDSQAQSFSSLDGYTLQPHSLHSPTTGNQIQLTFDKIIRLVEISIYVQHKDTYAGTCNKSHISNSRPNSR